MPQTISCFSHWETQNPKFWDTTRWVCPINKCSVNLTLRHTFTTLAMRANSVAWAQNLTCLWRGRATPNSSQTRWSRHARNPKQHPLINTVHYLSPALHWRANLFRGGSNFCALCFSTGDFLPLLPMHVLQFCCWCKDTNYKRTFFGTHLCCLSFDGLGSSMLRMRVALCFPALWFAFLLSIFYHFPVRK